MVIVNVLYPNKEGTHFDLEYYRDVHLKLVNEHWGKLLHNVTVDIGISGLEPGSKPEFYAITRIVFNSHEHFAKAMEVAHHLIADKPNYTDTTSILQISELM